MHRTTIHVPESLFRRAKIKALRENVAVGEVVRDLLARWFAGEIKRFSEERSGEELIALPSFRGTEPQLDKGSPVVYTGIAEVGTALHRRRLRQRSADGAGGPAHQTPKIRTTTAKSRSVRGRAYRRNKYRCCV